MNKKGFTLTELLCTITLMGIIATMASVNIVNIFNGQNEANAQNINNIIETAACLYLELDENQDIKEKCKLNSCTLSTDDLIKKGLLNEKDVDKSKLINITYQNNEKKCKVQE